MEEERKRKENKKKQKDNHKNTCSAAVASPEYPFSTPKIYTDISSGHCRRPLLFRGYFRVVDTCRCCGCCWCSQQQTLLRQHGYHLFSPRAKECKLRIGFVLVRHTKPKPFARLVWLRTVRKAALINGDSECNVTSAAPPEQRRVRGGCNAG